MLDFLGAWPKKRVHTSTRHLLIRLSSALETAKIYVTIPYETQFYETFLRK